MVPGEWICEEVTNDERPTTNPALVVRPWSLVGTPRSIVVDNGTQTKAKRSVTLAKEVGFCFGVKRAINQTRQALAERSEVFILGDLVHNKRVTDELEAKGLQKVEDVDGRRGGTMVIRAHGLPKAK